MNWNYRMVEFRDPTDADNLITEICEVYYDDNGKPTGYAKASIMAEGGAAELAAEMARISLALHRPVIDGDKDFEQKEEVNEDEVCDNCDCGGYDCRNREE